MCKYLCSCYGGGLQHRVGGPFSPTYLPYPSDIVPSQFTTPTVGYGMEASDSRLPGEQVERIVNQTQVSIEQSINQRMDESFSALSTQMQSGFLGIHESMALTGGILASGGSSFSHGGSPWASTLQRTIPYLRIPSSLCGPRCLCQCHSTRAYGKWRFSGLEQILGSVKIVFSGSNLLPRTTLPCSDATCKDYRRYGSVMVRYSFPSWLANAVLSVFFFGSSSPELLLRVHRVVSPDNLSFSIFGRIASGDAGGVKALIRSRPSSVHDITVDGDPPLLRAITREVDVHIVKILIQAGADPYQEDQYGVSAVSQAIGNSLGRDNASSRQVAEVLPISDALEEGGFTELHRLLMGSLPIELSSETLEKPLFRSQLNSKTTGGLTPLHIVASGHRHDESSAKILLEAGAEVDALTRTGYTPLTLACRWAKEGLALALLAAGASAAGKPASVSPSTTPGYSRPSWTPLHAAAFLAGGNGPRRLIDELISRGADVNSVSLQGHTPLMVAANRDNLAFIQHLVARHDADLDLVDRDGDTALYNAIDGRANKATRYLLTRRHSLPLNKYGWSILHFVAVHGDRETIAIVTEAASRMTHGAGVSDPYAHRDSTGKTAIDRLRGRTDFDDELAIAFNLLLDSIRASREAGGVPEGNDCPSEDQETECREDDDDVVEEEFHDAVENI